MSKELLLRRALKIAAPSIIAVLEVSSTVLAPKTDPNKILIPPSPPKEPTHILTDVPAVAILVIPQPDEMKELRLAKKEVRLQREIRRVVGAGTSFWDNFNKEVMFGQEKRLAILNNRFLVARGEGGGISFNKVISNIKGMKDLDNYDAFILYGWQNNIRWGNKAESLYGPYTDVISYLNQNYPYLIILSMETLPTLEPDPGGKVQAERDKFNQFLCTNEGKGYYVAHVAGKLDKTEYFKADGLHLKAEGYSVVLVEIEKELERISAEGF